VSDRRRVRLALAGAVVTAAAAAVTLAAAGGAQGGEGAIAWKGAPHVLRSGPATDRVLYGAIRNDSLRDVDLAVTDVEVLDGEGRRLRSDVRFLAAFAHGLHAWSQRPDDVGDFERRRLGEIATLRPGQSAPITLSWRVPAGGAAPAVVDLGPAELDLPAAARR
jgi:hypothetical protein